MHSGGDVSSIGTERIVIDASAVMSRIGRPHYRDLILCLN